MAFTYSTKYSKYVAGSLQGKVGFLKALINDFAIPNAHLSGAISVNLWSVMTAAAVVDGTMLTQGAANTHNTLAFVNQAVPVVFMPSAENSIEAASMAVAGKKAADALYTAAQTAVITGMLAATASGGSDSLANDNFSDPTVLADLAILDTAIATMDALTGTREEMFIAMPPNANGYWQTMRNNLVGGAIPLSSDGIYRYQGVPMHSVGPTGAPANWGGTTAGHTAAIVAGREFYACAFTPAGAYLHGGRPTFASDGTIKFIFQGPFDHGKVDENLFYEILNP